MGRPGKPRPLAEIEALSPHGPMVRLIGGPTASGKSALATALAERLGAIIVNADALQVYADLAILSARPAEADLARAPHRLYGVVDGAEPWSVGLWLKAAGRELDAARAAGRPAVVVGGTGLYFAALTRGLADIPEPAAAARALAQTLWDEAGEAEARARLAVLDPEAEARIAPGDRQRIVRALAVALGTDRPLSAWRAPAPPRLSPGDFAAIWLAPDRQDLYRRCDARAGLMLRSGAVAEVERLLARGLDPDRSVMKAVGVREIGEFLAGRADLDSVHAAMAMNTRRFAKRQMTWFRNQTPDWPCVDPARLDLP